MLCQFSVSNFRSFRDEAVLNMRSAAIKEHNDSIIEDVDHESFLPVAAIYGPNGGGKSNLCDAYNCLLATVVLPILTTLESHANVNENKLASLGVKCSPFVFDKSLMKQPTVFSIIVRKNSYEYSYHLSVIDNVIADESLVRTKIGGKKPAIIYSRDYDDIYRGASLKNVKKITIASTIPYLSFLTINYNIPTIDHLIRWFLDSYATSLKYRKIGFLGIESINTTLFREMPDVRMKLILSFLAAMDIPISGIEIDESNNKHQIKTTHSFGENRSYTLNINEESLGTQKVMMLLPTIIDVLEKGGVLFADELDARIHPKLLEFIIKLFSNREKNPEGAQLIHTSHDVTTMRNDIYRRDEIWFVARDQNGSSQLYSLLEFRNENGIVPRPDASFNKQYLAGRYGADPYLKTMFSWIEVHNESEAFEKR